MTPPIPDMVSSRLKRTPEQELVVGPLVQQLLGLGWKMEQMVYGRKEWLVPKTPSELTKREKGQRYTGFPVDIAIFDDPSTVGDPRHLIFLIECKQPDETAGVAQLESYFMGEPHARLGIWANNPSTDAAAAFLYRKSDGTLLIKRLRVGDLPRPGEAIKPDTVSLTFKDLILPSENVFQKVVEDLLDKVVARDANVTRREQQLDQLSNLLLLKLESDKEAKSDPTKPVFFRPLESPSKTAKAVRDRFRRFVDLYPETFTEDQDKELQFGDDTIYGCVESLSGLRLIDLGLSAVSVAFQVLRSEALKQKEGQYFTPIQVIQAGVKLLAVEWDDIVLDPACGTGGFLLQTMLELQGRRERMPRDELSRWAQTHIFGIDKDAIGIKLTKAIMQIAGDGSAHCARGDSVLVHKWEDDYPHLAGGKFKNGRFTVVVTNPPFGRNLTTSAENARLARIEIAKAGSASFEDTVTGLCFLERAYQWLKVGGKLGIVLPETYFFSPEYAFIWDWMATRLRPKLVVNIPMDAFQGFCRAKTNFYIFEKIDPETEPGTAEVVFLNPRTCGIYKNGMVRYKTDPRTGTRTTQIDNELIEHAEAFIQGQTIPGIARVPLSEVLERRILVPTYYDGRYNTGISKFLKDAGLKGATLGRLSADGVITIQGGHGSPSNDQRRGHIPYIKVSDIRGLRVNVNPTNLVSEPIARSLWGADDSGLQAWDLITPNRASSNIGEFSIILPGEERVVLTKEVFVIRVQDRTTIDPFYLLWALSLKAVREQWRRIALMQTNREDCGTRHLEILIPWPKDRRWAAKVSEPFRKYFESIAQAKLGFIGAVQSGDFEYVANVNPSETPSTTDDERPDSDG